ncbi:MAG: group II intron reverse transcriptase domain-containing protein [Solobacterium sp.]|nr:group II intron reverse transcriptase domain-containing protein [Solobacterium sp.]
MTILDELSKPNIWEDFRSAKCAKQQLSAYEARDLEDFIRREEYLPVTGSMRFGYPEKKQIAKSGSAKKRTVYLYSREETWVLKLLAFLLYRYDDAISSHCYSFRRHRTARTAISDVLSIPQLNEKYAVKADIHDYFNSIDTGIMCRILQEVITDDPQLLDFLTALLQQDACYENGIRIEEKRGAMAGVPLASFFANLYLRSLDELFEKRGTPYFRYSDDILIFTDSKEEQLTALNLLTEHITRMGLTLNPDKTRLFSPHEAWSFLGVEYQDGAIDLSAHSIRKMKDKIRRKANSLYRWRIRKNADFHRAARAMIRHFDQLFYDLYGMREFTWTRFYFPLITKTDGLHAIDEYMVMYLRFLSTGRHTKTNYRIRYDDLKKLGYTPLVSEYYRWKAETRALSSDG